MLQALVAEAVDTPERQRLEQVDTPPAHSVLRPVVVERLQQVEWAGRLVRLRQWRAEAVALASDLWQEADLEAQRQEEAA